MIPGETLSTGAPDVCSDCNTKLVLQVCKSFAGYYVGTQCDCGPCTRESGYYPSFDEAKKEEASDINNAGVDAQLEYLNGNVDAEWWEEVLAAEEPEDLPRCPDGTINNCALANGHSESECQMCDGRCPDRGRFK